MAGAGEGSDMFRLLRALKLESGLRRCSLSACYPHIDCVVVVSSASSVVLPQRKRDGGCNRREEVFVCVW